MLPCAVLCGRCLASTALALSDLFFPIRIMKRLHRVNMFTETVTVMFTYHHQDWLLRGNFNFKLTLKVPSQELPLPVAVDHDMEHTSSSVIQPIQCT